MLSLEADGSVAPVGRSVRRTRSRRLARVPLSGTFSPQVAEARAAREGIELRQKAPLALVPIGHKRVQEPHCCPMSGRNGGGWHGRTVLGLAYHSQSLGRPTGPCFEPSASGEPSEAMTAPADPISPTACTRRPTTGRSLRPTSWRTEDGSARQSKRTEQQVGHR